MELLETHTPVDVAVDFIAERLRAAIAERGQAVLMLSGGSSPRPVHEGLSEADLDWSKVRVGLVDERMDPAGSNAVFVVDSLFRNAARAATFVGIHPGGYTDMVPADVCVMGMGADGHTASWFPDSPDLARALDMGNADIVMHVDAEGCEGAGAYPQRLTLTRAAVMRARDILLFIPGAKKREVFHNREGLPIASLDGAAQMTVLMEPAP